MKLSMFIQFAAFASSSQLLSYTVLELVYSQLEYLPLHSALIQSAIVSARLALSQLPATTCPGERDQCSPHHRFLSPQIACAHAGYLQYNISYPSDSQFLNTFINVPCQHTVVLQSTTSPADHPMSQPALFFTDHPVNFCQHKHRHVIRERMLSGWNLQI